MNLRPLRPDQQQKQKPATRWSYHRHSEDFIGWVNKLGIEKTWVGRVVENLDAKFKLRKIAFLFLFSLTLSFLISWNTQVNLGSYKEGNLVAADIKSPITFDVIDKSETNRRKLEAETAIPPVYDYDVGLYDERALAFRTALKNLKDSIPNQSDFEVQLGGVHFTPEIYKWILKERFNAGLESVIAQNLEKWGDFKIVEDASGFRQLGRNRVIVNTLEHGYKGDEFVQDAATIIDTNEVRRRITAQSSTPGFVKASDRAQINEVLRTLIVPNLTLNKQETELRRNRARVRVAPFFVQIRKGQIIAHSGSALQRIHVEILDELNRLQVTRHQDFLSMVTAILFLILLFCYLSFTSRFMSKVYITAKDSVAMGSILIVVVLFMKVFLYIADAALIEKFTSIPQSFYLYLFPVSFGAMMVGLLIPFGEVVWLFAVFLSVVVGLLADKNFSYMVIAFTTSIVAARGVYGCKKREDLYWAGIKTGLVNLALVCCITLISNPLNEVIKLELAWNMGGALLSGLFACFVTLTLIPFWETLFIYTTDVKLLELSNLNHPLLKELIVQAPGTYHHSLVVGSMCEAAAEAIGANSLLAKVCAYYHDIGKSDHSQYFIENQRPGENRHDHINPGMSKTILIAHVKDGVEKALKYKLGQQIMDVIEQHHGTTLISFFYQKAKELEDSSMHEVTEDEYRYPGPKPEFREAALCMLADSIEAAARTLDEPTPARLQNIVRTIVQRKFLDGQLDNCDVTLKDLTIIEEAFARVLLGIYHQRIDYPTGPKAKKVVVPTNTSAS
jgi:putative nucleotidyltransferase with HDIG domain